MKQMHRLDGLWVATVLGAAVLSAVTEAHAQEEAPAQRAEPEQRFEPEQGSGGAQHAEPPHSAQVAQGAEDAQVGERAPRIVHVPPGKLAAEGDEIWFWASDPDHLGQIVVRMRPAGGEEWTEIVAVRAERGWLVRVPADMLALEGMEYWVAERLPDGSERAAFADAERPHPVPVVERRLTAYERRQLEAREGRRHRAMLQGEYVGLGRRRWQTPDGDVDTDEHYWRWEASYEHSFFTVVDSIRIRAGQMRGEVARVDGTSVTMGEVGVDYGRADVVWRAHDKLRFRTAIAFGFSQRGFEIGGAADLIIGLPEGPNLSVGMEGMTTLGFTGRLRLGWLVTPKLPMGATVEVTTFPVADEPGMRLLLDVAYELYPGAYVRMIGGYRGWTSTIGGPSLGAELALAF
jgi:hypothetical protein